MEATLINIQQDLLRFSTTPSVSLPTTVSSSQKPPLRDPISCSSAANATSPSSSSKTSPALWSAKTPKPAVSPRTAQSLSAQFLASMFPSLQSLLAQVTAPGTTACVEELIPPVSYGCGRMQRSA